jgi:uncharacterized protein (TIGR03437 family)
VTFTIGGGAASLLYAGEAPGLVGMLQINAIVPSGIPSGAVNAVLNLGANPAPAVAVWIQ